MIQAIAVDRVTVDYGPVRALDSVTFSVDVRDFVAVVGPNGSGKTTLLRVILGLLTPSAGTMRLFDVPPTVFRDWHMIGYVPQRTVFDMTLPVRVDEVVTTGLVASRARSRNGDARGRVADALAIVGLTDCAGRRIGALSAGQQQRVLIARALVSDPALLILDEPIGSVDAEAQASFYELLRQLNARGVTVVLVTHDVSRVARDLTKLVCLDRHVIFCGHPRDYIAENSVTYGLANA